MKQFSFLMLFLSCVTIVKGQAEDVSNLVFDISDLKIIEKADSILSDPSKWNKRDDRECNDDIVSGKYSLFCALYKASIDATGTYHTGGQQCK